MATLACYLEDGSVVNHPLDKEIVTIGRSPDSLIQLQCESVSSHHGMIKQGADGFLVQDLGSSNGTKVNGAPIEEAQLNDGDRVSFGGVQTVFYAGEAPAEPDPVIAAGSAATIPVPAPNLAVADTPAPNPVVAPKPKVPLKSRTPLKKKPLPHQKSSYEESEGGCMTAFMVTVLLILAFITGLALRHHNETDQNFFSDVIEKLTGEMPKIEIER
jgi:pSer/pThr/pTyr-binding forkhead associated (FHA) protein